MSRPRDAGFITTGLSVPKLQALHHMPFDFTQVENLFPRAKTMPDDKLIADAVTSRAEELAPSEHELRAMNDLVANIIAILSGMAITTNSFEQVTVEEVCCVGSFAMGTILAGHGIADIVVVLRTMPSGDAVTAITQKLMEGLREADHSKTYSSSRTERGFDILSSEAAVRILISTVESNIAILNPSLHLRKHLVESHHTAMRHAKWFEQNAFHYNVKMLARLLRDLQNRFDGLKPLSPWMICLLSQYAVINNPDRQPLAVHVALRRILQLLSSGFFLPFSSGLTDPCESGSVRVHAVLNAGEQDVICYTAQTLLRIYAHGGHKHILGIERYPNIISETTVWNGVVVTPSDKAYENAAEKKTMDTK